MEYELNCSYDSRKSFYNKAVVIEEEGNKKLRSYNTIVCEIKNNKPLVYGSYSNTTSRHIKEFLLQNGFKAENMKQILKDYSPTEEETNDLKQEEEEKALGFFNSVKMVCAMGEIMTDNQTEENDFKQRILKAGLGNRGLSFPSDWKDLTEEEKSKRLNQAIEIL